MPVFGPDDPRRFRPAWVLYGAGGGFITAAIFAEVGATAGLMIAGVFLIAAAVVAGLLRV